MGAGSIRTECQEQGLETHRPPMSGANSGSLYMGHILPGEQRSGAGQVFGAPGMKRGTGKARVCACVCVCMYVCMHACFVSRIDPWVLCMLGKCYAKAFSPPLYAFILSGWAILAFFTSAQAFLFLSEWGDVPGNAGDQQIVSPWLRSKSPVCSTAPSRQQPLGMGLGSGMFSMKYPPWLHFSCPPLLGGLWVSCSLGD